MSWGRLTRVEAPAELALSVEAAKAHLRIEGTTAEDEVVEGLVEGAIAEVDGPRGIGICLVEQTWRLSLDGFPCGAIEIPLGPVVSVASVTYVDPDGATQSLDVATACQVDTGREPALIAPAYNTSWPSTRSQLGAVAIEFVAGFADGPPADLVGALKLIVGARYLDRESGALPAGAKAVFDRYRAGVVA